jgi:hypothetical protein
MSLGGPEIKLPEVKAPDFLVDLYYDLRERHLLPLVAVLAVAIVAVPILFGGSGSKPQVATPDGFATLSTAPDGSHTIVVANATPGLRDYRRRLSDLQVKDPFKQQFSKGSPQIGSPPSSGGSGGASNSTATTPTGGGSVPSGGGTTTKVRTETKYASYEIDVKIVSSGAQNRSASTSKSKASVSVRRNLPELTQLPNSKNPAVVYMGVSADAKKAMLLVSSKVKSLFGDARCVIGSNTCQLLALEPGLPETIVYGSSNRTIRIKLLKISRVVTSNPPRRASFGASKKHSSGRAG